jgi:SAM-dependent methyltransferase
MQVDFGQAALDYARYRAGFPDRFYDVLETDGIQPASGADRALDIATGTGTIARSLARRGWRVDGIDLSGDMLAAARILDAECDMSVAYQIAPAETLPFADGSFALATAGTCWHWLDRARAAAEARRVLISGGHLVIASQEWREGPGNAVEATRLLIAAHNPEWARDAANTDRFAFTFDWGDELVGRGFTIVEQQAFEVAIPYSHEAWRGRIRASAGVGASLSADGVARFDTDLAALLARDFPADPLAMPHEVMMIVARAI